jgi:hypothetical protein
MAMLERIRPVAIFTSRAAVVVVADRDAGFIRLYWPAYCRYLTVRPLSLLRHE